MKRTVREIKDFVHSNLSRGDKSEGLAEDLLNAEKRIDLIRQTCQNSEKKITSCLQTVGGIDSLSFEKRLKKMPTMQLYQSFADSSELLGTSDFVLGQTLSECAKLQHLIGKELLNYEIEVEKQCINPLESVIENDMPNVTKTKKQLNKAMADMENYRIKYQTALKLMQQSIGSAVSSTAGAKAELLKKELEDSTLKVDHSRDAYASEMFAFLSHESEYARIFLEYYRIQANYHKKMQELMDIYLPVIEKVITDSSQKPVFGTPLEEHLRVNNREISLAIEICIGWLLNSLNEEGLFRIPGSTSKVKKLKHAFDAGIISIEEYARDSHTIAGTLKSYLRELPEPLLTSALYQEWINAAKLTDNDSRMQALWKVCNKLPKANFDNLRYLIKFLAKLSSNSDINKMSSQNIAIAISPSVIWTPQQDNAPFDLNMTAANYHSVIIDALINFSDWFFPGDINFVTLLYPGEKLVNGEMNYNQDTSSAKGPLVHRSAKKPAPPVPPNGNKVLERKNSLNGRKYDETPFVNSKLIADETETQSNQNSQLISTTSQELDNKESNATINNSSSHSSVIYSTASLDRHSKVTVDNHFERSDSSDKKFTPSINLRNKLIEKPSVPPPSVPNKTERPLSVYERPSIPPPERPQRSCDGNKVKQRSLECLSDDSIEAEIQTAVEDKPSKSNKLYPSLHDFDVTDVFNETISKTNLNRNDSKAICNLNEKDMIAYADDSDIEDDDDVNRSKVQTSDVQHVKYIPQKPPRALSPHNFLEDDSIKTNNNYDVFTNSDVKLVPSNETVIEVIYDNQLGSRSSAVSQQVKPPRPQPPNLQKPLMPQKPKIHYSSEDTHL